jgi:hypothetical protein
MSIVPQSPATSIAYNFGQRDAREGKPCEPEKVFLQKREQDEYAAGHASVTSQTAQAIVVPNYKRNGGHEFVRRTDNNATAIFKAAEAQAKRVNEMLAKTAAFLGEDTGEILFA